MRSFALGLALELQKPACRVARKPIPKPGSKGALRALWGHSSRIFPREDLKERRKNLPAELIQIEEILDRRIRPGLQGDGGDLKVLSYNDNVLLVQYQGACGTCPSSTTGTLEAIRAILQDEYDPEIEVYIAPEA